jgi:hypothetical protein
MLLYVRGGLLQPTCSASGPPVGCCCRHGASQACMWLRGPRSGLLNAALLDAALLDAALLDAASWMLPSWLLPSCVGTSGRGRWPASTSAAPTPPLALLHPLPPGADPGACMRTVGAVLLRKRTHGKPELVGTTELGAGTSWILSLHSMAQHGTAWHLLGPVVVAQRGTARRSTGQALPAPRRPLRAPRRTACTALRDRHSPLGPTALGILRRHAVPPPSPPPPPRPAPHAADPGAWLRRVGIQGLRGRRHGPGGSADG